jgi:DnaJ-class molecular chaperone
MDTRTARKILGLKYGYSLDELNKNYRMMALKYHPDKNKNNEEEATRRFAEVNEAHKTLLGEMDIDNNDNNDRTNDYGSQSGSYSNAYESIFRLFVQSLFSKVTGGGGVTGGYSTSLHDTFRSNPAIEKVIQSIISNGKDISIKMFEEMDKHLAFQIYDILVEYKDVLHISEDTITSLEQILKDKVSQDDMIILNPSLANLLDDSVYVLDYEGKKFYIPLWHNELYYKIHVNNDSPSGDTNEEEQQEPDKITTKELVVRCVPELPPNVFIDSNNNIYFDVRIKVFECFEKQVIEYVIPETTRKVYIRAEDLTLSNKQQVILVASNGIAKIDYSSTYNVTNRGCIYANIQLV